MATPIAVDREGGELQDTENVGKNEMISSIYIHILLILYRYRLYVYIYKNMYILHIDVYIYMYISTLLGANISHPIFFEDVPFLKV